MTHFEPIVQSRRPGLRFLYLLAVAGLTVGLTFILDLLFLSCVSGSQGMVDRLLGGRFPALEAGFLAAIAVIGLTPMVLGRAFRLLQRRSLRGWVYFGLQIATVLVGDLVLIALFPAALEAFNSLAAIIGFNLCTVFFVSSWLWQPSARRIVLLGLLILAVLVINLMLVAFLPPLQFTSGAFMNQTFDSSALLDLGVACGLMIVVPVAVFLFLLRRGSWPWIGGGYLALAPLLAYLATDDPIILRPVSFEEIAPAFSGASASFEVLMRYGKLHPLGKNFRAPGRIYEMASAPIEANKPDEWPAWLKSHRAGIEADWAELAPVRAWIDELNRFDRIGDLTEPKPEAELIMFAPLRAISRGSEQMAGLLAVDGHGDQAIATLLPALEIGRKLEPSSRLLVRSMIGRVMQNMGLETARFVLDTTTVSPEMRTRLAAALATGSAGEPGIRRLVALENILFLGASLDSPLSDFLARDAPKIVRQSLNLMSPLVYNRKHTANVYGEFTANLQDAAARRDLRQVTAVGDDFGKAQFHPTFKNFMGAFALATEVPAYTKITERYWKTEDARAALRARLTNP